MAEITNEFEFLARENFSGGIIRRIQDKRFGLRSERAR